MSVWQISDKTNILSIEFSGHTEFYNMPQHAGTMPKLCGIDVYTIFRICNEAKSYFVAFGHTA